jgi:hypothetical protein
MANSPGDPMIALSKRQAEAIRAEREILLAQIQKGQETIARSQSLVARLDRLLAELEAKS